MENLSLKVKSDLNSTDTYDRGYVFSDKCPSREILNHVTNKWGCLALVALLDGTMRFSDLRRKLQGVSEKMLAQTLQILEADGFVIRTAYPVIPPHVEYNLSVVGREMAQKVHELIDFIETNLPQIREGQKK